jgi:hypothetical protein
MKIKQESLQLTGGNNKNDRRELDFYPTPANVTVALMEFLQLPKSRIWEIACGDGAMSKVLESYGHDVYSTELRQDSGYGKGGVDFLEYPEDFKVDAIITNPPFNVSQQFIEKSLRHADTVAMLLKSQYWHGKKRLSLFNEHTPSWVLPLTWRPDFLAGLKGGSPTMECIWTVWRKGDTNTKYRPLEKPVK